MPDAPPQVEQEFAGWLDTYVSQWEKELRARWLPGASESAPGAPPRPGLSWKEETHRWVHADTGADYVHADKLPPPDATMPAILGELATAYPTEAADAGVWARVKGVAGKLHTAVYGVMLRATPYIVPIASELFDTPADFQKFGYAPGVSGTATSTGDPMKAATGISTHLAISLASKVLARAFVWAKSKVSESEIQGPAQSVTDWLLELFKALDGALGVETPVDRATVLAEVQRRLTAKEQ